jgi:hypothetical protein
MSRHGDRGGLHLRKRGLQEDDMKRWMTALGTLAVAITSSRCAPVVIDPVDADPDGGGEGAAPVTSLAMPIKDVGVSGAHLDTITRIDGENLSDPNALVLMFGNQPVSCTAPRIGIDCSAPPSAWQGDIVLPSALVQVGPVDLADPSIAVYQFTNTTVCTDSEQIVSLTGTLDIVSIDADSITVDLIDGFRVSPESGGLVEGTFTLARCP